MLLRPQRYQLQQQRQQLVQRRHPTAAAGVAAITTAAAVNRRTTSTRAAAGRGFGGGTSNNKPKSKGGSRSSDKKLDANAPVDAAVKQALRLERQAASAASSAAARPIDSKEAARGRIDVATITDWGGGGAGAGGGGASTPKLGDLRVKSVETRFDASGDRPFSAQLATLLQQLEVRRAFCVCYCAVKGAGSWCVMMY